MTACETAKLAELDRSPGADVHRAALAEHPNLVGIPDDLPFDQAAIIPAAVAAPQAAIVATAQACPAQSAGVWGFGG